MRRFATTEVPAVSRRDGKARMPWSVKGVSPEARELAKSATSRDGETMGEWLSDVIRRVGAAQAAGRSLSAPNRRALQVMPGRRPIGESRRPGPSVPAEVPPAAAAPAPDTVDEEALVALVAERIERTENRLAGLMESLEDIIGRLAHRLEHLEDRLGTQDTTGRIGDATPQGNQRSLPDS